MAPSIEDQVRDKMRARTCELVPSPDLLAGARQAGIRHRRRSRLVASTGTAAVLVIGAATGWAATQNGDHRTLNVGVQPTAQQPGASESGASESGAVRLWHGRRMRAGVADPFWHTGPALTRQLRSFFTYDPPGVADWYIYGTAPKGRFTVTLDGNGLVLNLHPVHGKSQMLLVDLYDPHYRKPVAVLGSSASAIGGYVVAWPGAKLAYHGKDSTRWLSAGRSAALIPLAATEARVTIGEHSTLIPLH
jgi:hypothetical protein